MAEQDTIAAIATAIGAASIGVVRISGVKTRDIARKILRSDVVFTKNKLYCDFFGTDQKTIDKGVALFFKGPNSFTGEDVLELQGHGGVAVLNRLLKVVLLMGARMAEPGEFSKRAFLNGKLDLLQAESISQLIAAKTEAAAMAAVRSLSGDFSQKIKRLQKLLHDVRVNVEAAIDFSDEDNELLQGQQVEDELQKLLAEIRATINMSRQGRLLTEGLKVVIIGKPNAGKSSLLNKMAAGEHAIVTNVPGTTRDVIKVQVSIKGVMVELVDTAGLRETCDVVEQMGVEKARQELQQADMAIVVIDLQESANIEQALKRMQEESGGLPSCAIVAANKVDLTKEAVRVEGCGAYTVVFLSAKSGGGVELLLDVVLKKAGFEEHANVFAARTRHIDALRQACTHIKQAMAIFKGQYWEILAEKLREAQQELSVITGEVTADDLLGKIFSEFCVGK